jgi:hypothetical protein
MPGTPSHDVPRREPGDSRSWFRIGRLAPPNHPPIPWPAGFSAALELAWDERGLLVRADLRAPAWHEDDAIDQLWRAVSLELIVAPGLETNDRCQWIIAPGMDPLHPQPRWHLHDHRSSPALRDLPADATLLGRVVEGGCRLEVRLPWSALAIVPRSGREIRFQAMANGWDEAPDRQPHLVWFPRFGAANEVRPMHRLRLADAPSPERRATLRRSCGAAAEWHICAAASDAGRTIAVLRDGVTVAAGLIGVDGTCLLPDDGHASVGDTAELLFDGTPDDAWPLRPASGPEPARRHAAQPRLALDGAHLTIFPDGRGPWRITRRQLDGDWQELALVDGPWRDCSCIPGTHWEYGLHGEDGSQASAYLSVGTGLPAIDQRGIALLVVDAGVAGPLAPELARLNADLIGDGWTTRRIDIQRTATPEAVRQAIAASVRDAEDPACAILIGRIPVPYAGRIQPDGHPEHAGSWPCDALYAAPEAAWSDLRTVPAAEARQANAPSDGRYDQDCIPDPLRLAVGRIDMRDLPAFPADEITLLRAYLDRNHAWRHGRLPADERGVVQDGFPFRPEGFARSGWGNAHALFGPERALPGDWPWLSQQRPRLLYACGGGGYRSMGGFGTTDDLARHGLDTVFSLLFGSYFGDWDQPDNLMRAALAAGALTCGWAGRPHWFLHPMALGGTIGDALLRTQRNIGADYRPIGSCLRGIHIALLGDPTLRLHPLPPPGPATALRNGRSVSLHWLPAPTTDAYHIYRDDGSGFRRLTDEPIRALSWTDADAPESAMHLVRAVARQQVWCGDYANLSQGVIASGTHAEQTRVGHASDLANL